MRKFESVKMPTPEPNAAPVTAHEKELLAAFYLGQVNGMSKLHAYFEEHTDKFDSVEEVVEKIGDLTILCQKATSDLRKELDIKQKPVRLQLHGALGKVQHHLDADDE